MNTKLNKNIRKCANPHMNVINDSCATISKNVLSFNKKKVCLYILVTG